MGRPRVPVEQKRAKAALRQRRCRAQRQANGVMLTLGEQELGYLTEMCHVRRPGRVAYAPREFIELLIIREWQRWQQQLAALGVCRHCGKDKLSGGCQGEFQNHNTACWLTYDCKEVFL